MDGLCLLYVHFDAVPVRLGRHYFCGGAAAAGRLRHLLLGLHDNLLEFTLAADFGPRHIRVREQSLRIVLGCRANCNYGVVDALK